MAPQKITAERDDQGKKIHVPNLESLLRKSFDDDTLQVVDYESTPLVPPGENYCSIMIKLDVRIRRGESEKLLHLVAKAPSLNGDAAINWMPLFKKEIFMYTELRLLYRELEMEVGFEESERIDVWPGYFGYRNSLNDDDDVDNDSLLLMENMKADGFCVMDRKKGLDVHHARKALALLARYHALGIVMKKRRPSFVERAIEQAQPAGLDFGKMEKGFDSVLRTILETPCLQKHLSVVRSVFERAKGGNIFQTVPAEPWTTITHGDFWVNNMLFRKDEAGNVDDVKFVDFQMYLHGSALRDLPYFFTGSLDATTQASHLDDLIGVYYDGFLETLSRMDCDVSPFSRQSFERELKEQAINLFPLCVLATKFFVYEVDHGGNDGSKVLTDTVFDAGTSVIFANKLKGITAMYERMGWF